MKVAFVGKGGAGKSALAGTLCRVLARRGQKVLALDADHVPGLALSIGLPAGDGWILSEAAAFREGRGWEHLMTPVEAVERFALSGPDGVRFLQFGKTTAQMSREQQASAVAFLEIVRNYEQEGVAVVIDLAAGTRQSYLGWTGVARTVLVVVEPSEKSLLTARRILRLREERPEIALLGVANKIGGAAQRRRVAAGLQRIGIPYWAEVPEDHVFGRAEREGRPPIEVDPASGAVRALEEMADRLVEGAAGPRC
ncbi:MAG: cellulose synthase operon protein YhjQ/BcsQ [Candidatus Methylomirabilales bacterium]